jgi:hypothetical protein
MTHGSVRLVDVPLVRATAESLRGFGEIVRDPKSHKVQIVPWPVKGHRALDPGTGHEGGTTEGIFACEWRGNELRGVNAAVGGDYVLGYRDAPGHVHLWHCNYHPDGGQLFFPLDPRPFYVPLALPGDDVTPERFVCFRFDGRHGLYIHPNIWHEGVFGARGTQRFFDKQGAVHARVSVDFAREFDCLLEVTL